MFPKQEESRDILANVPAFVIVCQFYLFLSGCFRGLVLA